MESRMLKPLLLPKEDRLLWAATALQKPSVLTGLWVRKQQGNRWCLGRIVDTDINNRNSEAIWQVRYHDGDKSDYNLAEIVGLLLPPALNRHLEFPLNLLGAAVQKLYDKTTFHGKITSTPTEKQSQITHWNVRYSDGDSSNYNIAKIASLLTTKKPQEKVVTAEDISQSR
jgi:hypothetical protein